MSQGMCKVTMLGTLGIEPELRYGQGGTAILNLRVAVNRQFGKGPEKQEATDWWSCAVFGKRAEGLAKVLKKGDQLCLSGDLRSRTYDDRDGNKRTAVEIAVSDVAFAGGKRRDGGGHGGGSARAPNPDAPADDFAGDEPPPDSIPF